MRTSLSLSLILLLGLPVALAQTPPAPAAPAAAGSAPALSPGEILRPEFRIKGGKMLAGTAFALDVDGAVLAVTAFHLFGPVGGLERPVSAADLPSFVKSVTLRDAWTDAPVAEAGPPLALPDAAVMGGPTASLDLAAFPLLPPDPAAPPVEGAVPVHVVKLAAKLPKVGDPVWVAAPVVNAAADHPHLLAARVVEVNNNWLFYSFADTGLDLTATSGAPVLDAAGEVVGMHLGGGKMDSELVGSANPLPAHRDRLVKAMGKQAP